IELQCRSAFRNVRTVLEDAGSSWDRIVDVTVYLTDMKDFAVYNRIYAEHFTGVRPARTTVEVSRLPTDIAIELKVIATIDRNVRLGPVQKQQSVLDRGVRHVRKPQVAPSKRRRDGHTAGLQEVVEVIDERALSQALLQARVQRAAARLVLQHLGPFVAEEEL